MKNLLGLTLLCFGVIHASAQTWASSNLNTNSGWNAVASSADGTRLVATGGGGGNYIYTSSNSGITWTKTSSPNAGWSTIASSADGTKLVAAVYGGSLYTSTNSGNTWTSYNAEIGFYSPNQNWLFVSSSADGTKLMAAVNSGGIFSSTNSGNTWFTNNVNNASYWGAIASSAGGAKLAALTSQDDPAIYTSTNTGRTWRRSVFIGQPKGALAAAVDGSKLMVLTAYEMYLSTDWGTTWTTNNKPFYFNAPCVCSADLSKLWVMGGAQYQAYYSTNYGATWVTNNLASANWSTKYGTTWNLATSADGNNLVGVAGLTGGVWVLQTTPSPQLNLVTSSNNIALSWIVPSTNFVLQQNPDLTMSNWTALTNTPMLNLSNLQEQVWFSSSNTSGFFRLLAQ